MGTHHAPMKRAGPTSKAIPSCCGRTLKRRSPHCPAQPTGRSSSAWATRSAAAGARSRGRRQTSQAAERQDERPRREHRQGQRRKLAGAISPQGEDRRDEHERDDVAGRDVEPERPAERENEREAAVGEEEQGSAVEQPPPERAERAERHEGPRQDRRPAERAVAEREAVRVDAVADPLGGGGEHAPVDRLRIAEQLRERPGGEPHVGDDEGGDRGRDREWRQRRGDGATPAADRHRDRGHRRGRRCSRSATGLRPGRPGDVGRDERDEQPGQVIGPEARQRDDRERSRGEPGVAGARHEQGADDPRRHDRDVERRAPEDRALPGIGRIRGEVVGEHRRHRERTDDGEEREAPPLAPAEVDERERRGHGLDARRDRDPGRAGPAVARPDEARDEERLDVAVRDAAEQRADEEDIDRPRAADSPGDVGDRGEGGEQEEQPRADDDQSAANHGA